MDCHENENDSTLLHNSTGRNQQRVDSAVVVSLLCKYSASDGRSSRVPPPGAHSNTFLHMVDHTASSSSSSSSSSLIFLPCINFPLIELELELKHRTYVLLYR